MMSTVRGGVPKCRLAAMCMAVVFGFAEARAQQAADPWREPQDTVAALLQPDQYAWRLFVALNWPANAANRVPDPGKPFGAPGPVVWETWRNVRPEAPGAVFPPNGSDP